MSINGNYSQPVSVNGYQCWNCTDVDNAKKHIDPQHPKSGPYGITAAEDPTLRNKPESQKAIIFGGSLMEPDQATSLLSEVQPALGTQLDVAV